MLSNAQHHAAATYTVRAKKQQRARWRLPEKNCAGCGFTNQSGCFEREDGVADDEQFARTARAMEIMSFSQSETESVFSAVSAVMHLGNIAFAESPAGASSVADESTLALESFSHLLGFVPDAVQTALCSRSVGFCDWLCRLRKAITAYTI